MRLASGKIIRDLASVGPQKRAKGRGAMQLTVTTDLRHHGQKGLRFVVRCSLLGGPACWSKIFWNRQVKGIHKSSESRIIVPN